MRSTLFVTTILALSLSTAAMADERDRYRSDRRDDRYQDRYDDRYRGDNRGDSRYGRTDDIAREIERTAAAMRREYDGNNRRPDRDEARVSAALRELHEEAYQLSRQGGSYNRDSRRGRGYDGLLRAFERTADSLERIAPRPYVDHGMERIWRLMSQLDRQYGGRSDRYDRGWRDRDYRDRDHGRYRN
jgi:hypothetical protein